MMEALECNQHMSRCDLMTSHHGRVALPLWNQVTAQTTSPQGSLSSTACKSGHQHRDVGSYPRKVGEGRCQRCVLKTSVRWCLAPAVCVAVAGLLCMSICTNTWGQVPRRGLRLPWRLCGRQSDHKLSVHGPNTLFIQTADMAPGRVVHVALFNTLVAGHTLLRVSY